MPLSIGVRHHTLTRPGTLKGDQVACASPQPNLSEEESCSYDLYWHTCGTLRHNPNATHQIKTKLSFLWQQRFYGDIPHKTEAGAVALNTKMSRLLSQAKKIWKSAQRYKPNANLEGILVQSMASGVAEVLVGYKNDIETGPAVILGPGGVLAEIYNDVAIRPAPVDLKTAKEMVQDVRGLAPIRGYRNLPKGDVTALAKVVTALSKLAAIKKPLILEAEINPLA